MDLLHQAGYDFETRKSGFPEVTLEGPVATVLANARGKALAVAKIEPGRVVLAADTVVYRTDLPIGERIFGQAGDPEEVRRMLSLLHGRVHEVYSGVAVTRGEQIIIRHSITSVRMREIPREEREAYALSGEGIGKAGGYAIQGRAARFVEWIGGDYTNVVGLPLALTGRMLAGFGVRLY